MIDITTIIEAILTVLGVIITAIVIPYIQKKTSIAQREQIQAWISIAVFAAEQIYSAAGQGEAKKAYVIKFLNQHNITFDSGKVDAMIESTVKSLNIQQGG